MTEVNVWDRLDYGAGRPTQRTMWWLRSALLAVIALALLAITARTAGVFGPRLGPSLTAGSSYGYGWNPASISFTMAVQNEGWFPVTIVGAGESFPGLELLPALAGMYPVTLQPGDQISLPVQYSVTDCTHRDLLIPLAVRVRTTWGIQTVRVGDVDYFGPLDCTTTAPRDQLRMAGK